MKVAPRTTIIIDRLPLQMKSSHANDFNMIYKSESTFCNNCVQHIHVYARCRRCINIDRCHVRPRGEKNWKKKTARGRTGGTRGWNVSKQVSAHALSGCPSYPAAAAATAAVSSDISRSFADIRKHTFNPFAYASRHPHQYYSIVRYKMYYTILL